MDLNQLLHRHQVSLMSANAASGAVARCAHQGLATLYADRIRGGLLTPEMIASRAKARGVSERDYMSGNLLGREVTADDVADAFLYHALALKTTGDVTTVDGGNIEASLR